MHCDNIGTKCYYTHFGLLRRQMGGTTAHATQKQAKVKKNKKSTCVPAEMYMKRKQQAKTLTAPSLSIWTSGPRTLDRLAVQDVQ